MADYILSSKRKVTVTETIIPFLVPLYVVVRQEKGFPPYIAKVVVDDEAEMVSSYHGPSCDGNGVALPDDDPTVKQAINLINQGQCEWPSWQFGW